MGWKEYWYNNHNGLRCFYSSAIHLHLRFLAVKEKREIWSITGSLYPERKKYISSLQEAED